MNKNFNDTVNIEKILLEVIDKYNKFWETIRKEYKFKKNLHFRILKGYIEVRARKEEFKKELNGGYN